MAKKRRTESYRFPGLRPREQVSGVFGDPKARVVRLERTGKKLSAALAESRIVDTMTAVQDGFATFHVATRACSSSSRFGEFTAKRAAA
jgi:hypothetical protein